MTYSVFCYFFDQPSVKIKSRLTLDQARKICDDPQTSSRTTDDQAMIKRWGAGPWFYGYTEE